MGLPSNARDGLAMTATDRERERILKLRALLRENGVSVASARREARTGLAHARAEEMRRRPEGKIRV